MKRLLDIRDSDIFPAAQDVDPSDFTERQAVRAVVTNELGQIALLYSVRDAYHKLPGGGIEPDEDLKAALRRETQEEIGSDVEVGEELGEIVEYKSQKKKKQTSSAYLARQTGEIIDPTPTEKELAAGFEPKWVDDIDSAIAAVAGDTPTDDYVAHFIRHRDLAFLKAAKQLLDQ